jgi:hypothetical protein
MIKKKMISLLIIFSVLFIMGCATDEYYVNNVISNSLWEENSLGINYDDSGNLANKRIGMGTNSPEGKMHITITSAGTTNVQEAIFNGIGAAGILFKKAQGTPTTPTAVATNSELGGLTWRGYNGSTFVNLLAMRGTVDGSLTKGMFRFQTADGGGLIERMRLSANGNLGIATTSPSEKLHVVGNVLIEGNLNVTGCVHYNGGTLGVCI